MDRCVGALLWKQSSSTGLDAVIVTEVEPEPGAQSCEDKGIDDTFGVEPPV